MLFDPEVGIELRRMAKAAAAIQHGEESTRSIARKAARPRPGWVYAAVIAGSPTPINRGGLKRS